jgi:hypothetical protein
MLKSTSMTKNSRSAGALYAIELQARPGADGVRQLRGALKVLGRRFGLRAVSVSEIAVGLAPAPPPAEPAAAQTSILRHPLLVFA